MTSGLVLMIAAGLSFVLVVLQILLHGAMPVDRRLVIERVLIWGLCPALVVLGVASAVLAWGEGMRVVVGSGVSMAMLFAALGIMMFNKPVRADGTRT